MKKKSGLLSGTGEAEYGLIKHGLPNPEDMVNGFWFLMLCFIMFHENILEILRF